MVRNNASLFFCALLSVAMAFSIPYVVAVNRAPIAYPPTTTVVNSLLAWPMYGNDGQHTGQSNVDGPASSPRLLWFAPATPRVQSAPDAPIVVGADGTIYVGSDNGLLAVNSHNGRVTTVWNKTGWSVYSIAIRPDGTIIAGANYDTGNADEKGTIFALFGTGAVAWNFTLDGLSYTPITVSANGTAYVSAFHGSLYALDKTGGQEWARPGSTSYGGNALGQPGIVYSATESDLRAYRADGSLVWTVPIWADAQLVVTGDGTILVTGYQMTTFCISIPPQCLPMWSNRTLFALDPRDGSVKWSKDDPSPEIHPTVGNGAIYIPYTGSVIQSGYDGSVRWNETMSTSAYSGGIIDGNGVFYVQTNNGIAAVNGNGQLVWRSPAPGTPIAFSRDGALYYYNSTGIGALAYPDFTVQGVPANNVSTITVTPTNGFDGNVSLTLSSDLSRKGFSCTLGNAIITEGLGNSSLTCSGSSTGTKSFDVIAKSGNLFTK